jgi:hypothetical protein
MNIHTVKQNLLTTIASKEKFQDELRQEVDPSPATKTLLGYLAINLVELRGILADVEVCCEQATEASWALNPDRSGGQFTQDEIDNAGRWV